MISLPDLAQKSPYEFYGRCLIKTRHLLYMYQYLEQILFLTRHLRYLSYQTIPPTSIFIHMSL